MWVRAPIALNAWQDLVLKLPVAPLLSGSLKGQVCAASVFSLAVAAAGSARHSSNPLSTALNVVVSVKMRRSLLSPKVQKPQQSVNASKVA